MNLLILVLLAAGIASAATIEASAFCSAALFGERSGETECRIGGGEFHDEQADIYYGYAEATSSMEFVVAENQMHVSASAFADQRIGAYVTWNPFHVAKYGSYASASASLAIRLVPYGNVLANRVLYHQSYELQNYEDSTRGSVTFSGIDGASAAEVSVGDYSVQFDREHPLDLSMSVFFEAFAENPFGSQGHINAQFDLYFFNVQPCTPEQDPGDCGGGEYWEPVNIAEYAAPQEEPVPEPGTFAAVALGALALARYRRRLQA